MNQTFPGAPGGFTLVELLVCIVLFSIVSAGAVGLTSFGLKRIVREGTTHEASLALEAALNTLGTELRGASAISPFLPGINQSQFNCAWMKKVEDLSLRFVIATEDAAAPQGRRLSYVGYRYVPEKRVLLRGIVPINLSFNCLIPAQDPVDSAIAFPLVQNVVQLDTNKDGIMDPVFINSKPVIEVNLGVNRVNHSGAPTDPVDCRTQVWLRSWE